MINILSNKYEQLQESKERTNNIWKLIKNDYLKSNYITTLDENFILSVIEKEEEVILEEFYTQTLNEKSNFSGNFYYHKGNVYFTKGNYKKAL